MCSWLYSSSIFHENNLRKSSNIIPVHTAVVCSEEIISQTIIFRLSLLLPFSLFLDRCQNTFSSADLDFLPSSFNCHWRCHCGDFQAFLKLKYCLDISTRTCLRRRNFCWTILLYSNSSVAFYSIPSLSRWNWWGTRWRLREKIQALSKKKVLSCTSPPSTYCMNVNFYLLCIFLLNIYKLKTFQCRIDRERVLLKSFGSIA